MPDPSYNLGHDAIRELQDVVQWYRGWKRTEQTGAAEPFTKFGPRTVRWAKCMANSICSSYPSSPANTFPIRMGELDFDDTACGFNAKTFTAYDPVMDRVALDNHDTYHHSGEIVLVFMCHGRWYILGQEQLLARSFLAADMCPTDADDEQLVNVTSSKYLPTCETFTPAKVVNPHHHRGADGAKLLMVKEHCQGADEQWVVIDVELTRACVTVGLENTNSCLLAPALRIGAEWAPCDEPIKACKVIEYEPCPGETALAACVDDWVFEPLYACCGQQEATAGTTSPSSGSTSTITTKGPGPLPGQFLP